MRASTDDLLHSLFLLKSLLGAEFGKKSAPDDLNMPEYALLRCLARGRGADGLTSVCVYLAVTKSSVSQTLAALEKRALLVRSTDPADRRNLIVTLTPEGSKRLRSKEAQVERRLHALLGTLGEANARAFIALIDKMNAALSANKEEA